MKIKTQQDIKKGIGYLKHIVSLLNSCDSDFIKISTTCDLAEKSGDIVISKKSIPNSIFCATLDFALKELDSMTEEQKEKEETFAENILSMPVCKVDNLYITLNNVVVKVSPATEEDILKHKSNLDSGSSQFSVMSMFDMALLNYTSFIKPESQKIFAL